METEAYYALGGGGLAWLVQMVWQRVFSTEGKANDALVQQMAERMAAQEVRITALEAGLDAARERAFTAESKVHVLELYVMALKAELQRHGIDVPAPLTMDELKVGGSA